ncbi:MAG: septum formation initiator family protein [bacterium]|nr:septum formation initiator family protein [bacterium]
MKLRYLFLVIVAGTTLAGYVLVFGDQGYLRQSQAEQELAETRAAIRGLEKENENLTRQYARLSERVPARPDGSDAVAQAPAETRSGGTATILKFEDDPLAATPAGGTASTQPGSFLATPLAEQTLSLTEARALFLTGMFFLAILGFYGITRLERLLRAD